MVTIPLCYSKTQQKGRPLWTVQINVVLPPSRQTLLNWIIGDSKPPSDCLNDISFTNVSFQAFLCWVLILSLWPLSCLYLRYNRKKLCCLGGLTLQLLFSSLVYKTECVKWIPVQKRVRWKSEGKFQVGYWYLSLSSCSTQACSGLPLSLNDRFQRLGNGQCNLLVILFCL